MRTQPRAGPRRIAPRLAASSARRLLSGSAALLPLLALASPVAAQAGGVVTGTVTAQSGEPLASASVTVAGSDRGALTDARGHFRIVGLPAGEVPLRVQRLGYTPAERTLTLPAGGAVRADIALAEHAVELNSLVISATRETRLRSRTPASVGVVAGQEIRDARPAHPSEIVGRVAGVWVSPTSGEGHTTAIRQPKSTKPMYLFLEDGVPTRSTGFFNHNALYEVNVPQADRIEVLKGPATALYGSDAIGGVINVETRRASLFPQGELSLESGSNGWGRVLASGSTTLGQHGLRTDLNLTRSDGFRDASGYGRQSGTLRWDAYLPGNATLKTVATFSRIDQNDASSVSRQEFDENPALNYNRISFRKVDAFGLSAAYERVGERSLLSVTPFLRANSMDLLPSWMVSYEPVVYNTGHRSFGALARFRRDFGLANAQLIGGLDVEYSPGWREERSISLQMDGKTYAGFTGGDLIYDYDVAFRGVSPYLQLEAEPLQRLRLSAGLRFDHIGYDYETRLDPLATGRWRRPESTKVRYDHLSPKLGATWTASPALGLFAGYRHGFRAPSEGQLFRQGSSSNGPDLKPVKADNLELGVRGELGARLQYEASVYRMEIRDDVLTYATRVNEGVTRVNVNAGRTRHEGVELALGAGLGAGLRLDVSYSNALHTYDTWAPNDTTDYSGRRMESAPRELTNARLGYAPGWMQGARLGAEWVRVGSYFMDVANEHEYAGHDLLNLRLNLPLTRGLELVGRVSNLLDTHYAESASVSAVGEQFSPGAPRQVNLAVQYRWQR
jgi:iron complex outermembrane recepter protein